VKTVLRQKSTLLLLCSLPTLLVGCSLFETTQPPAPVYSASYPPPNASITKPAPVKKPKKPKPVVEQPVERPEPEVVQTKPLTETRPAPTITPLGSPSSAPLTFEQEQALLDQELRKNAELLRQQQQQPPAPTEPPKPVEPPAPPPPVAPIAIAPPPPPPPDPPPPPFQPLETFAPFSPVVNSLVLAANQSQANPDVATTTIERAIRIEPRNPSLFYKLAVLRLKQKKPELAEELAKKTLVLAASDAALKKHGWLLIAQARDMRGDKKGAKEARATADKF
jgi:predicted Zn-dependent protease